MKSNMYTWMDWKKRSNLLDFINLLWQNLDKPVKESFTTVSAPFEPRGSIFQNGFLSGVLLIFDLPGDVIETGFYWLDWVPITQKFWFLKYQRYRVLAVFVILLHFVVHCTIAWLTNSDVHLVYCEIDILIEALNSTKHFSFLSHNLVVYPTGKLVVQWGRQLKSWVEAY